MVLIMHEAKSTTNLITAHGWLRRSCHVLIEHNNIDFGGIIVKPSPSYKRQVMAQRLLFHHNTAGWVQNRLAVCPHTLANLTHDEQTLDYRHTDFNNHRGERS